ncbi:roadblock/LC7 domain-containing protein [Microbacterium sp. OR21]|uniref:roadblock/LC7 domain-containing protein n=1 Tax=Microbacterium sp. OR21 TaxID=3095346 RepID=UPI0039B66301
MAHADGALRRLQASSGSLRYAAVLTDDGFAVSTLRAGADADSGRFASIASTLQALGEAAGRELLTAAGSTAVLIDTDAGRIAQLRVHGTTLVLAALFAHDGTADGILTPLRDCATALAAIARRRDPSDDPTETRSDPNRSAL